MQHALRPYVTAGVAVVGASVIVVTPLVAPRPAVQERPVRLVDAWSDLITNTTTNLDNIVSNADLSDISQVFSALITNPFGVISALTNLDPTVTTDLTSLPATISVELPPGLELGIANLAAWGATATAINDVIPQLQSDPSGFFEDIATVLNAYLNGQDNISLLDGAITIPAWNGILAPETSLDINLNLTSLIDALGLGNTPLTSLDLSNLLSQLGLGDLTLGGLFSDLGISNDGLGTLLGDPSLGTLLSDLGLSNLGLGSFSLTSILGDLGLDSTLGQITLTQALDALGLNTDVGSLSLTGLISDLFPDGIDIGGVNLGTLLSDLGIGSDSVGSLLGTAGISDLAGVLNAAISGPLSGVATELNAILSPLGLSISDLLSTSDLTTALDDISLSTLVNDLTLGSGSTGDTLSLTQLLDDLGLGSTSTGDLGSITTLLGDLGITLPSTGDLTISSLITDVLHELNVNIPATGDIDLSTLLGDLNVDNLSVGGLLDTVNLGGLLDDLGLSNLPLNLSDLGDLSTLTLGGLLDDLGLGDLANITVEPLGGYITELVDTVPQQILAAI